VKAFSCRLATLILDTNVVLDWLVFCRPELVDLTNAVNESVVSLLTHDATRSELLRVLNYPLLKLEVQRQGEVYATYCALCDEAVVPDGFSAGNLMLPEGFPKCRDPDDQLFLALAFHSKADALVSRDRQVLALRKKARKFGVTIVAEPLSQMPAHSKTVHQIQIDQ
jgi:putative PIN family toxin of toxin-antitoxin system